MVSFLALFVGAAFSLSSEDSSELKNAGQKIDSEERKLKVTKETITTVVYYDDDEVMEEEEEVKVTEDVVVEEEEVTEDEVVEEVEVKENDVEEVEEEKEDEEGDSQHQDELDELKLLREKLEKIEQEKKDDAQCTEAHIPTEIFSPTCLCGEESCSFSQVCVLDVGVEVMVYANETVVRRAFPKCLTWFSHWKSTLIIGSIICSFLICICCFLACCICSMCHPSVMANRELEAEEKKPVWEELNKTIHGNYSKRFSEENSTTRKSTRRSRKSQHATQVEEELTKQLDYDLVDGKQTEKQEDSKVSDSLRVSLSDWLARPTAVSGLTSSRPTAVTDSASARPSKTGSTRLSKTDSARISKTNKRKYKTSGEKKVCSHTKPSSARKSKAGDEKSINSFMY